MTRHALVVRLDSLGDLLICGPAIRAVAATVDRVTVLAGPLGAAAARLLPGVDDVLVWRCPWIASPAPAVDRADVRDLVAGLAGLDLDEALILTSFHQSPLPTALLLRLAGVPRIAAASVDYPGSLLDQRLTDPPDAPEPVRMVRVAEAAGYRLPAGDDGRLALRGPLPEAPVPLPDRFVVVHPGTSAAARSYPGDRWRELVPALGGAGWPVVVTGSPAERELTAAVAAPAPVAAPPVLDLGGRLDLPELAAVLRAAAVVVVANTGPAHLAAAVGTPVVSLFAPVVPAVRWAPFGVPVALLGNQTQSCAGTRWTSCALPGHPCLSGVEPASIVAAVDRLAADLRPATLAGAR